MFLNIKLLYICCARPNIRTVRHIRTYVYFSRKNKKKVEKKISAKSPDGARRSNRTPDQWLGRQMSQYILFSMEVSCIRVSIRVENQYDVFISNARKYGVFSYISVLYSYFTTIALKIEQQNTMGDSHQSMQFIRISSTHTRVIVRDCCARYNYLLLLPLCPFSKLLINLCDVFRLHYSHFTCFVVFSHCFIQVLLIVFIWQFVNTLYVLSVVGLICVWYLAIKAEHYS